MKNVAQPLRHTYCAAQKNHLPATLMRLPHSFSHVFDASVKLFARLPVHKKGCTGCTEFFEFHAPVAFGYRAQVVRRDKNLVRGNSNSARILCLLEALFERIE